MYLAEITSPGTRGRFVGALNCFYLSEASDPKRKKPRACPKRSLPRRDGHRVALLPRYTGLYEVVGNPTLKPYQRFVEPVVKATCM